MRQLPVYWGDLSHVWVNYCTLYFIFNFRISSFYGINFFLFSHVHRVSEYARFSFSAPHWGCHGHVHDVSRGIWGLLWSIWSNRTSHFKQSKSLCCTPRDLVLLSFLFWVFVCVCVLVVDSRLFFLYCYCIIINLYLILISAMYIIHLNKEWSPFSNPIESIIAMFIMSLGEFGDYYVTFKQTDQPTLAKVCYSPD